MIVPTILKPSRPDDLVLSVLPRRERSLQGSRINSRHAGIMEKILSSKVTITQVSVQRSLWVCMNILYL